MARGAPRREVGVTRRSPRGAAGARPLLSSVAVGRGDADRPAAGFRAAALGFFRGASSSSSSGGGFRVAAFGFFRGASSSSGYSSISSSSLESPAVGGPLSGFDFCDNSVSLNSGASVRCAATFFARGFFCLGAGAGSGSGAGSESAVGSTLSSGSCCINSVTWSLITALKGLSSDSSTSK